MATRWKHEDQTVIIGMHAHNQWSNYYSAILSACAEFGLPVQEREFANHYDDSPDREWCVCTAWLNRHGGSRALISRAREIQDERASARGWEA